MNHTSELDFNVNCMFAIRMLQKKRTVLKKYTSFDKKDSDS